MPNHVKWLSYNFDVFTPQTIWRDVAGIYIFCGVNREGRWEPLYIGQSSSLAERLATHERWSEAERLGATHIHVRAVPQEATRLELERQLIGYYQPRLNVQLKESS